ncbi:hypothetical protein KBX50_05320 [Micromonospora sp. C51]|uniref:hypothetical protein n=1 Tax=Micromonospora sp. C51 TaxID=2824879 RepID=UPI001B386764|nr:hypothetical protein [Micromonospora sp. C51]MBQ1047879.1 hypothetical protein [Micromonospora sp. C51]
MRINRDAYLTRAQAAFVTRVTADAIGKWHARGWLNADGERQRLAVKRLANGNVLYRLGDILDAERDTAMNPNSRRGASKPPSQYRATPCTPRAHAREGRAAPSVDEALQENCPAAVS